MSKQKHYLIPVDQRIDLDEIMILIEQEKYFVLHAPRQTGKTTALFEIMKILNNSSKYKCLYVNVEGGQTTRGDVPSTVKAILERLSRSERNYLNEDTIAPILEKHIKTSPYTALSSILSQWTRSAKMPTVLLIDEIDSLVGDSLISVLRQLREGYADRPKFFPQSVILCGVRDVRDYRIETKDKEQITGGSCFNINAKSLRLGDFNASEIKELYEQHTNETGQTFAKEAIDLAFDYTNGQPWLVNALGYEACFEMKEGKNRKSPITAKMIQTAANNLIQRRVTHLDQLIDKLKEPRVRGVIEPMIKGESLAQMPVDDLLYTIDLGLVKRTSEGIKIANRMYAEVIPRELGFIAQTSMESNYQPAWYVKKDGSLDSEKLIENFQQFFREHSESWVESLDYKEAGPQLLLQAFLQRVVNGGGRILREYGLGRMRTDLMVEWNDGSKIVIELKLLYKSLEATIKQGLEQTYSYMDKTGSDIAHLLIFDRTKDKSWDEKIFRNEESYKGKTIVVWGM
jgi:hypothetical protein